MLLLIAKMGAPAIRRMATVPMTVTSPQGANFSGSTGGRICLPQTIQNPLDTRRCCEQEGTGLAAGIEQNDLARRKAKTSIGVGTKYHVGMLVAPNETDGWNHATNPINSSARVIAMGLNLRPAYTRKRRRSADENVIKSSTDAIVLPAAMEKEETG